MLCVVGVATLAPAQGVAPVHGKSFALPWNVSFEHIRAAMDNEFGTCFIEQTRRQRVRVRPNAKTPQYGYQGTLERLLYRGADPVRKIGSRFRLEFRGLEGQKLSKSQFDIKAREFQRLNSYKFRYQGFRVAVATLAAKVYDLVFLTHATRTVKEGNRSVYRMAVLPKKWDRTAWILELDTQTGYPLYSGEYSLDVNLAPVLQSELIVTSFIPGARVPDATDPGWWTPSKNMQVATGATAALKIALTASTKYVLPRRSDLPSGFEFQQGQVHTDPYKGTRKALLRYSDGIDHVWIQQRNIKLVPRQNEDTIARLTEKGMTRCLFNHGGVEFLVLGRANRETMRYLAAGLFSHAIQVLP